MEPSDGALNEVMLSYNTPVNISPGFTPQFLMSGKEERVASEVIIGVPLLEQPPSEYFALRYKQPSVAYDGAR